MYISSLGAFQKASIGQLWAKHIKFEEQVDFLQKSRPKIVIGTPNRYSNR